MLRRSLRPSHSHPAGRPWGSSQGRCGLAGGNPYYSAWVWEGPRDAWAGAGAACRAGLSAVHGRWRGCRGCERCTTPRHHAHRPGPQRPIGWDAWRFLSSPRNVTITLIRKCAGIVERGEVGRRVSGGVKGRTEDEEPLHGMPLLGALGSMSLPSPAPNSLPLARRLQRGRQHAPGPERLLCTAVRGGRARRARGGTGGARRP